MEEYKSSESSESGDGQHDSGGVSCSQHGPAPGTPTRTLVLWVLLTSTAGAIGSGVVALFAIEIEVRFALFWAAVGLVVGAMQSLVLMRESLRTSKRALVGVWWTLSSAMGLGIGSLLGIIPSYAVWLGLGVMKGVHWAFTTGAWTFAVAMTGLFTTLTAVIAESLVQECILRKELRASESDHWAFLNVLGWLAACVARYGMLRLVPGGDMLKGLVAGAVGGLSLGGITGPALVRMLETRKAGTRPGTIAARS